MPNWVTNKIIASPSVIAAMLNSEGRIDFETMMPSPCPVGSDWNGVYGDAETAAELVCGIAVSDNTLLRRLELMNRAQVNVAKMTDESFDQFIGMMRNFRACGYLHDMDFNRKAWGTKWNACEQMHDVEAGTAEFETAWSCPRPVLEALSKRFPLDEIKVEFADEDIGSNCGTFSLRDGVVIQSDIAPNWNTMSGEMQDKWRAFACEVKGLDPSDYQDEE